MAVTRGPDLTWVRNTARMFWDADRDDQGMVRVADGNARAAAACLDDLVDEVERLRAELDLLGAGCATVIRCGETIRIIGPDGRGVFATINARMMESPPVRLAGRTDPRVIRQQGDELLLGDGERAVRVPISMALDALFPIAVALDEARKTEGEGVQSDG